MEHTIDRSFDVYVVGDVVLQEPEPLLPDQVRPALEFLAAADRGPHHHDDEGARRALQEAVA